MRGECAPATAGNGCGSRSRTQSSSLVQAAHGAGCLGGQRWGKAEGVVVWHGYSPKVGGKRSAVEAGCDYFPGQGGRLMTMVMKSCSMVLSPGWYVVGVRGGCSVLGQGFANGQSDKSRSDSNQGRSGIDECGGGLFFQIDQHVSLLVMFSCFEGVVDGVCTGGASVPKAANAGDDGRGQRHGDDDRGRDSDQ